MQTLVVGYDGSEESKRALERAAAVGRAGASVTVVTAVSIGAHAGGRSMGALNEDEIVAARETLDAVRSSLAAQGIDAHAIEGEGDPADVIIEAAKERGADLIVVGTRGRNLAQRLVLGSVSTKVVHEAPCDVLVVR
jgi:nucleotide-binding universal stress UspA family protein